jgi:serine/threonine protein kinase
MLHFKRFGQYEILRKLGRSMTDVYLAIDTETNRKVALKIIEESRAEYQLPWKPNAAAFKSRSNCTSRSPNPRSLRPR